VAVEVLLGSRLSSSTDSVRNPVRIDEYPLS
jgi:hypothetical protein